MLFTDKSKEDIINSFTRKIEPNGIEEKEKYVVSVKFASAITTSSLKKIFQHYIIYSSFKQNDNVILNVDDKRNKFNEIHLKKLFDDYGIDYNELEKLGREKFYTYYKPHYLSPKLINAINDHYKDKFYEEERKRFSNIQWIRFQKI